MQTPMLLDAPPTNATGPFRWQRMGLPVPPSWRVMRAALEVPAALQQELEQLASGQPSGHFWVLWQGLMNPESQRQSLLNLSDAGAVVSALKHVFARAEVGETFLQLIPDWHAAGVLFTRHPLRRDLDQVVVEGVTGKQQPPQRLILDRDGHLAYRSQSNDSLDSVVPLADLLLLANQLEQQHEHPQAAEWVYDGARLWMLQTLPIGSLPSPKEAWANHVDDGFWSQAVTPLWYTMESRWLKNRFWEPLVKREAWKTLERVEPYRRQNSHIYRNSQFFMALAGFEQALPPAWRSVGKARRLPEPGLFSKLVYLFEIKSIESEFNKLVEVEKPRWHGLMEVDLLGEELATVAGTLHYRMPFLDPRLRLPPAVRNWLESGKTDTLRAGMDPVFPYMGESPAEATNLPKDLDTIERQALATLLYIPVNRDEKLLRQTTDLRARLADTLRQVLLKQAADLLARGLLEQPEDIFFCYFDELWRLCDKQQKPESMAGDTLAKRKRRYLEDAHAGAPDWKLDGIGFGFNQDRQPRDLLLGRAAVSGSVKGKARRLVSSWGLNQIAPGDIVVLHQTDPHWLPWLTQAGGIILSGRDERDPALLLAKALGIPCIRALSDAMHCLVDGQLLHMDAESGRVEPLS